MKLKQADMIWQLMMEISSSAIAFGRAKVESEDDPEECYDKASDLMQAKSKLYRYLKEKLDDTESL